MLKLTNLSKVYRDGEINVRALDNISLNIEKGEMVSIMGPSGSGKSTLMNILGLLDRPLTGSYFLEGREVGRLGPREQARIRNRELGFVFQSFNLLARLTALRNVELPLIYAGLAKEKRMRLAREALARVGLENRINHRPKELSGGQQQRVAIARALVNRPKLILADEPTGNLDSRSSLEIISLFQELHAGGITVILVTHEPDIAEYTQRTICFLDGRIKSDQFVNRKTVGEGVA